MAFCNVSKAMQKQVKLEFNLLHCARFVIQGLQLAAESTQCLAVKQANECLQVVDESNGDTHVFDQEHHELGD